jgi:hypothetical protein
MASIKAITKAKIFQAGLKRLIGIEPAMSITDKYVKVFYPPDKLGGAQKAYKKLIESPPGDVRVDIKSIVQPYYVKKLIPLLAGSAFAGFLIGGK